MKEIGISNAEGHSRLLATQLQSSKIALTLTLNLNLITLAILLPFIDHIMKEIALGNAEGYSRLKKTQESYTCR